MASTPGPNRSQPAGTGTRAGNLSLSAGVREEAKAMKIDITHAFIAAYNAILAAEGLSLEEWRSF